MNRSDSQDYVGKSHQDRQHLRYLMCNSLLGELSILGTRLIDGRGRFYGNNNTPHTSPAMKFAPSLKKAPKKLLKSMIASSFFFNASAILATHAGSPREMPV